MVSFIRTISILTDGHYKAALEHRDTYKLDIKPNKFMAFVQSIIEVIKYKVVVDYENRAYLVYNVVNKFAMNARFGFVVNIYVPYDRRGLGIASKMKDMVQVDLAEILEHSDTHKFVGKVYLTRSNK